jgi:glucokinase
VVIAGDLGLRLADRLAGSGFEARFLDKGRLRDRMATMPVKLITYPEPGLFGAAVAFAHEHL